MIIIPPPIMIRLLLILSVENQKAIPHWMAFHLDIRDPQQGLNNRLGSGPVTLRRISAS